MTIDVDRVPHFERNNLRQSADILKPRVQEKTMFDVMRPKPRPLPYNNSQDRINRGTVSLEMDTPYQSSLDNVRLPDISQKPYYNRFTEQKPSRNQLRMAATQMGVGPGPRPRGMA